MEYFWKEQDDVPAGMGYPLFGIVHIMSTGITLLMVLCGIKAFLRLETGGRKKVLKAIPLLMLFMEIFKDCFLIRVHRFGLGFLPLHVCSIGIFIFLIREYVPSRRVKEFCGELSYVLIMPASFAALLFPDWTVYYPVWNFMNLYSYMWHGLLILYPLLLRLAGEVEPSIRHIYRPVIFLLVVTPFIYLFDKSFNCNYFFVNVPPAGTPLKWIASVMGSPGYLVGYAVIVMMVFVIVYFMDRIIAAVWNRRKKR